MIDKTMKAMLIGIVVIFALNGYLATQYVEHGIGSGEVVFQEPNGMENYHVVLVISSFDDGHFEKKYGYYVGDDVADRMFKVDMYENATTIIQFIEV